MNQAVILAALSIVAADFSGDLQAVSSLAASLQQQVDAFASGQGIAGALGIQGGYPTLSSAVVAAGNDASSPGTIDASAIGGTLGSVTTLLNSLKSKAADFSAVNAGPIVAGDINGLIQPAEDLISKVVSYAQANSLCDDVSSLAPAVSSFSDAFNGAASANAANAISLVPVTCAGGAAPASSGAAAESSAAAPAESSAAAPAAPSAAGNGTASNGTDVTVTDVVTAWTTYCPGPTTFAHGNKTYTVTGATTLTITDCPCTVTKAPGASAPAAAPTAAGNPSKAPAPANAAAVVVPGVAAVAGVAALFL